MQGPLDIIDPNMDFASLQVALETYVLVQHSVNPLVKLCLLEKPSDAIV